MRLLKARRPLTVEDRASNALGKVSWWNDGKPVPLTFAELCDVIREFEPKAGPDAPPPR